MNVDDIRSPFYQYDEIGEKWAPSIREDAVLSRREALESCIEGIRQTMKPEEFGEVIREILKPPQEEL